MTEPSLIIVGAGGFGLEVAAYAEDVHRADSTKPRVRGFLDDTKPVGAMHAGYPVLGGLDSAIDPAALYIFAIGFPDARLRLADDFVARGARFHTLIHPQTYVATSAQIGEGCILAPFSIASPETVIGDHCILNHYASVGHESYLGDCSVLSPHASLHGKAWVGRGVFLGSCSYVTSKVKVGDNAKLSAGTVVFSDVPPDALAMGNPAVFRVQDKAA